MRLAFFHSIQVFLFHINAFLSAVSRCQVQTRLGGVSLVFGSCVVLVLSVKDSANVVFEKFKSCVRRVAELGLIEAACLYIFDHSECEHDLFSEMFSCSCSSFF